MHFFGHRPGGQRQAPEIKPTLPPPSKLSTELRFLDSSSVHFRRNGNRLQMRQDAESAWQEVNLVRLFPLSEPDKWISLVDQEGKEIGILQNLVGLSPESREHVEEVLRRRYLVPRIHRILACRDRFDLVEWTVETDRGRVTFQTRNLREQVREPLPNRLTLTDVEGNRYDVLDVNALDPQSRRMLEERL